jgi:hypothetical protein
MEYMQIVQVQNNNLDNEKKAKKKRDDDAVNLFRYIIRNNFAQLEKLFIENGYDRI